MYWFLHEYFLKVFLENKFYNQNLLVSGQIMKYLSGREFYRKLAKTNQTFPRKQYIDRYLHNFVHFTSFFFDILNVKEGYLNNTLLRIVFDCNNLTLISNLYNYYSPFLHAEKSIDNKFNFL